MQAQVIKQVILIKKVKGQQEKKPVLNLKSIEIVGLEKTPTKLMRFLFCKNNFFIRKKL